VKDALAGRYGDLPFDIIGASAEGARQVLPSPPARPKPGLRVILRAIRAHQWLKNTLIFLPVLAGQRLTDGATLGRAGLAFVAFSLVASCVYVLNDLLDLEDDRRHPTKRLRPFASGALPLSASPVMLFAMLGTALTISLALLPAAFTWTLAAYFALSFAYSLKLKGAVLIDVFTLAALYTLRVIAGSAATGIEPSVWLLGFCMFFFLSLALVKRYAELHSMRNDFTSVSRIPGRSYEPGDLPVLVALGVGTGCLSVLVLALYVISDEFAAHYTYPFLIWQLCPLALYWIGRAWMVVARDEMHDDPLIWAVRDQLSRWVVIAAFLILIFAR
jgi:4-hydroxybenzoate polyprenyltransferase